MNPHSDRRDSVNAVLILACVMPATHSFDIMGLVILLAVALSFLAVDVWHYADNKKRQSDSTRRRHRDAQSNADELCTAGRITPSATRCLRAAGRSEPGRSSRSPAR